MGMHYNLEVNDNQREAGFWHWDPKGMGEELRVQLTTHHGYYLLNATLAKGINSLNQEKIIIPLKYTDNPHRHPCCLLGTKTTHLIKAPMQLIWVLYSPKMLVSPPHPQINFKTYPYCLKFQCLLPKIPQISLLILEWLSAQNPLVQTQCKMD